MTISTKVEYALLALLKLAQEYQQDSFFSVTEIAKSQNIPVRYLDQILILLQHQGIIKSHKGAKGGYILALSPQQISLLDVVVALEIERQAEKLAEKSSVELTIITEVLGEAEQLFQTRLKNFTLEDICQRINS